MAKVYLHKTGIASDVVEAVGNIYELLVSEFDDVDGRIWLIPSVDIHSGTGIHDIDVLMIGYLEDYYIDEICSKKNVQIKSFCSTIEIKSHGADGISKNGTHLFVKYHSGFHDVTKQSMKQKETCRSFLSDILQYRGIRTPFVTNIIWLSGIDYCDFESSIGLVASNILTNDASLKDIFVSIGRQYQLRDNGYIDSFSGMDVSEIEKIANIFCAKTNGADTMTLRKMNSLFSGKGLLQDIEHKTDPIIVLKGHAGTGKTIMLLQAADVLTRMGKKCIFLTYNNALISDIKHTLLYMNQHLADFQIQSMHSYMISILYQMNLWRKENNIESDFLSAMGTLCRKLMQHSIHIPFDYVFVDEAQDWEKPVTDALKMICSQSHIVIADGIDQFMRKGQSTNWGKSDYTELKKCLRQRNNLTIFAKMFAAKFGVSWNVLPNNELPGGRVIVRSSYDGIVHKELLTNAKQHGCKEYDMMLLAPKSLRAQDGTFLLKQAYKENGINLFDGFDTGNREKVYDDKNAEKEECRVFTYESCRGLEAWTVVCLRFNELFEQDHYHSYKDIEYDAARMYMLTLWTLIPITRAVDTLVLVASKQSMIYKVLQDLATEIPDIVSIKN